jgi:hypothetical protein
MFYVQERGPNIATEISDFGDRSRAMGVEWKAMGAEAKEVYVAAARKDKERYAREVEEWKARAVVADAVKLELQDVEEEPQDVEEEEMEFASAEVRLLYSSMPQAARSDIYLCHQLATNS